MNLIVRENQQLNPFHLFEELERDFWGPKSQDEKNDFAPDLELVEDVDHYKARLDVPGIAKADLSISIENKRLTIQGERKDQSERKEKNYYYSERNFGSFKRVIRLPANVKADKVEATYQQGVLEVVIPKSGETKPKNIEVQVK